MLKRWLILSSVGYIVLVVICVFIGSRRNRPLFPEPLPLRTVAWQEIGMIRGVFDLDADGNDELLVQDKRGRWWWVKWGEKTKQ